MKSHKLIAAVTAFLIWCPASAQPTPTFTKITEGPLVEDRLDGWFGLWGDYDNDERLDVLVVGPANEWRLYHNDGGANFSAVTDGGVGDTSLQGMYGAWGDPDNDGNLDFYAGMTWNADQGPAMYWNNGLGDFVREPVGSSWTSNEIPLRGVLMTWGDFEQDGFLDAFLGGGFHYVNGVTVTNALLHNNADGTFAVVTDSILNIENDGIQYTFAVDYDNDGDLDLVPLRHNGPTTRFYQNDGQGVFTEATPEPILSEVGYRLYAGWADFDNDGDLDVIFGGTSSDRERFYVNNGDGTFVPWTGVPDRFEKYSGNGWGTENWGDYDNDGYLDLAVGDYSWGLWRNLGGGSFEEIVDTPPSGDDAMMSQSACWVDFNNDGFLDLFVANLSGNVNYLYMNNGNTNHWLEVKLRGTVSNRLAVGAKIFATANIRGQTVRQLRGITANDFDQTLIGHFGLGDATKVDLLRIEWPSGIVQDLKDVATNQILTVTEPPRLVPQGVGKFQIRCWVNQTFDVQCSTDLTTWTTAATVTNETGTLIFEDAESDQHHCRHYRVTVP
jgi:hypothetical protein